MGLKQIAIEGFFSRLSERTAGGEPVEITLREKGDITPEAIQNWCDDRKIRYLQDERTFVLHRTGRAIQQLEKHVQQRGFGRIALRGCITEQSVKQWAKAKGYAVHYDNGIMRVAKIRQAA